MRRLLIPLLLTGTLFAACGGGGSGTAAKTASQAGGAAAGAAGATTTSTAAGGAVAAATTTSVPQFSGNGGSSWCDFDRSLENSTKFQDLIKDPHAWAAAVNAVIPQVESKAPAAIRADVQTLVGALRILMQALVAANYDFSKINAAQIAGLQNPNFTAASDRITAYDKQVCGTKG